MIDPTQQFFLLALIYVPVTAMVCGLITLRLRQQATQSLELAATLDDRLAAAEQKLERAAQQLAEQERRLHWHELRSRPQRAEHEAAADKSARKTHPSMTERRHRVLSLARRGVEAEQIAETLGMPYGEVELIISLSSAA